MFTLLESSLYMASSEKAYAYPNSSFFIILIGLLYFFFPNARVLPSRHDV